MTAMTDYLEGALITAVMLGGTYTGPGTVYLSLHTADPGETGYSNEVTGVAYARVAVLTTGWTAVSNGTISNNTDITFPTAGGSWGIVTHLGIGTASTSGTLLFHTALANSRSATTGDVVRFSTGGLTVRFQ